MCAVYTYFCVWETRGLALESIDAMIEETGAPWKSAGWKPQTTYAAQLGLTEDGDLPVKSIDGKGMDEKAHLAVGTKTLGGTQVV